eukprot:3485895-Karenia_brevis.AAC.1
MAKEGGRRPREAAPSRNISSRKERRVSYEECKEEVVEMETDEVWKERETERRCEELRKEGSIVNRTMRE